ncbi:hypothetical protein PVPAM_000038100 [Plasmodium vivax]|nr:hypothetical protein PVPAM_000038100 [Plasmodium vivax]
MSDKKEFILDKIKDKYKFIGDSTFYSIYREFSKKCHEYIMDRNESCAKDSLISSSVSPKVSKLLKELYSNLYRIYKTIKRYSNDYFEEMESEVKNMGCLYLKHWLYDQITINELQETEINELFEGWEQYIKKELEHFSLKHCEFYNLKENEINRIKKIHVLNKILHYNGNNSESFIKDKCIYMDYFGEGLDEFISSINKCSIEEYTYNYCKELKEFLNTCKDDNEFSGISIYDENTKSEAETARKYFLFSEKYKNEQLYMYVKDRELLNFVKTSHFLSNKSTTIAATSVVGSAIGLSSIFYYFYKFTPFGSTLRKGQRKNIVNIDGEAHNELSYTSDIEQASFKNREYKVAYHSYNNS